MNQLMRHLLALAVLAGLSASIAPSVSAQVTVRPYTRSDGTPVKGHMRSVPDGDPRNNYGYPGNVNPYTGKVAGGNEDTYLRTHDVLISDQPFHTWPGLQPR